MKTAPVRPEIQARIHALVAECKREQWDDARHDLFGWFAAFFNRILDDVTPEAAEVPRLAKMAGLAFDRAFTFPQPIEALDGPAARIVAGFVLRGLIARKAKRAQPKPAAQPKPSEPHPPE